MIRCRHETRQQQAVVDGQPVRHAGAPRPAVVEGVPALLAGLQPALHHRPGHAVAGVVEGQRVPVGPTAVVATKRARLTSPASETSRISTSRISGIHSGWDPTSRSVASTRSRPQRPRWSASPCPSARRLLHVRRPDDVPSAACLPPWPSERTGDQGRTARRPEAAAEKSGLSSLVRPPAPRSRSVPDTTRVSGTPGPGRSGGPDAQMAVDHRCGAGGAAPRGGRRGPVGGRPVGRGAAVGHEHHPHLHRAGRGPAQPGRSHRHGSGDADRRADHGHPPGPGARHPRRQRPGVRRAEGAGRGDDGGRGDPAVRGEPDRSRAGAAGTRGSSSRPG